MKNFWEVFLFSGYQSTLVILKTPGSITIMHNKTPRVVLRIPFIAAPAFLVLYGIAHFIDGLDDTYGPGLAWTIGHIMFLCALLTFGWVILRLRRIVNDSASKHKFIARPAAIVGLVGLAVFVRVAVIDTISGLLAANHPALGSLQNKLSAYPSAALESYFNIGPLLFQLGMLTLMIQLALLKPRRLPWWSPILLFSGFLMLGFDLNLLVPGALLIGCALMPLALSENKVL